MELKQPAAVSEEFVLHRSRADQIHFVHSQELLSRYPDPDAKGRERAIVKDSARYSSSGLAASWRMVIARRARTGL